MSQRIAAVPWSCVSRPWVQTLTSGCFFCPQQFCRLPNRKNLWCGLKTGHQPLLAWILQLWQCVTFHKNCTAAQNSCRNLHWHEILTEITQLCETLLFAAVGANLRLRAFCAETLVRFSVVTRKADTTNAHDWFQDWVRLR